MSRLRIDSNGFIYTAHKVSDGILDRYRLLRYGVGNDALEIIVSGNDTDDMDKLTIASDPNNNFYTLLNPKALCF